jgi:hypothetical protein
MAATEPQQGAAARPPALEDRLSAPGSKAGRLQRALLQLHAEHARDGMLPTSGRFLGYELV